MSKTPVAKRERAIAELMAGASIRAAAKTTGLAKDTVQRISAEVFGPKKSGPRRRNGLRRLAKAPPFMGTGIGGPGPLIVTMGEIKPARYAVRPDGTIECYSLEDALALSRALKRRASATAAP